MAKKRSKQMNKKDESKLFAWIATFLSIVGFVIALIAKKDDKYVMYYARQSLVIFIIAVIAGIIRWIFMWIPVIGAIINAVLGIIIFILWLISWIYALSGEEKSIPVVSEWADKIKL